VTVTRFHILACAGIVLGGTAVAQNAPKPVARADYIKTVDDHFNGADTNHDGFISRAELVAQQQRDLDGAKGRINQQLQVKFNQLDTNHDGKLSVQEFMGLTPPLKVNETAEQMLARLDANHDGKISAAEFRDPELAKFNKIDANHDGVVSVQELQAAAGRK
jgi:Ca2+-binding EF-hand superfamily protein